MRSEPFLAANVPRQEVVWQKAVRRAMGRERRTEAGTGAGVREAQAVDSEAGAALIRLGKPVQWPNVSVTFCSSPGPHAFDLRSVPLSPLSLSITATLTFPTPLPNQSAGAALKAQQCQDERQAGHAAGRPALGHRSLRCQIPVLRSRPRVRIADEAASGRIHRSLPGLQIQQTRPEHREQK